MPYNLLQWVSWVTDTSDYTEPTLSMLGQWCLYWSRQVNLPSYIKYSHFLSDQIFFCSSTQLDEKALTLHTSLSEQQKPTYSYTTLEQHTTINKHTIQPHTKVIFFNIFTKSIWATWHCACKGVDTTHFISRLHATQHSHHCYVLLNINVCRRVGDTATLHFPF